MQEKLKGYQQEAQNPLAYQSKPKMSRKFGVRRASRGLKQVFKDDKNREAKVGASLYKEFCIHFTICVPFERVAS
jgi:hypothetical protein